MPKRTGRLRARGRYEQLHRRDLNMTRSYLHDLRRELANLRNQANSIQGTIESAERALIRAEAEAGTSSTVSRRARRAGKKKRTPKPRFRFPMIDAQRGTILRFKLDQSVTCEVANDTKVRYNGRTMSIGEAADLAMRATSNREMKGAGTAYWLLDGIPLNELRDQMESS